MAKRDWFEVPWREAQSASPVLVAVAVASIALAWFGGDLLVWPLIGGLVGGVLMSLAALASMRGRLAQSYVFLAVGCCVVVITMPFGRDMATIWCTSIAPLHLVYGSFAFYCRLSAASQ